MLLVRLFLCAMLACGSWSSLCGSDDPELRKQADTAAATGMQAMRSSDSDHSKLIDAAFDFSKALKLYQKLGDTDAVCQMQANVYWCKKKMNADDLEVYLRKKAGTADAPKASDLAEKAVDNSEAHAYFLRAEKFAKDNPDQTLQIIIRWFEVAERFSSTDDGQKASKLMWTAQKQLNDELAKKSEELNKKETDWKQAQENIFTHKTVPAGTRSPQPNSDTQRKLVSDLKTSVYKADYAKSTPDGKRTLAAKLHEQALKTNDDPNIRFVMLNEAARLAGDVDNCWLVLTCIDQLGADFEGLDVVATKKAALGRMSRPSAKGALKLLETPNDPAACTIVGRHFATLGQWPDALSLLSKCDHADLKALATKDMTNPTGAGQQVEVGDGWYDASKKNASAEEKVSFLGRAREWYQKAEKDSTGVSKDRITARLEEIDRLCPPPIDDWNKLTVNQWNALKGTPIIMDASRSRCDTGIALATNQSVRVVPHPTDKWKLNLGWGDVQETTWQGRSLGYVSGTTGNTSLMDGEIAAYFHPLRDKSSYQKCLKAVTGPGRLFLGIYSGWTEPTGTGTIRIKIIPYQE